MTTLVTGAAGFIGSALFEELTRRGEPVRTLVRQAEHAGDVVCDLNDALPADLFDGIDQVVHLAGLSDRRTHEPSEFDAVNHDATVRLARSAASAGVRHFIWTSSVFVHGDASTTAVDVDAPLQPADSYARSKCDAERSLATFAAQMQVTVLRLPLVLVTGVARPTLASRLVRRLPVIPVPSPPNRRSFISRDAVVQHLSDRLAAPAGPSQIVIPAPDGVTGFEAVLRAAAEVTGSSPRYLPIPRSVFATVDASLKRLGRSSIAGLYTDFEVVGSSRQL